MRSRVKEEEIKMCFIISARQVPVLPALIYLLGIFLAALLKSYEQISMWSRSRGLAGTTIR